MRALTALLVMAAIQGAAAEDLAPDTVGLPVSLTLNLTGAIAPHCGFSSSPEASVALGDLGTNGSLSVPFTVDCNALFDVKVASSGGALTNADVTAAPESFATRLDYTVGLSVATDLATVSGACAVSALSATGCALGSGLSSGNGVAIGTAGALTLSWAKPALKPVAGNYQDRLTLVVEVRS
jgi:hypothetical protein